MPEAVLLLAGQRELAPRRRRVVDDKPAAAVRDLRRPAARRAQHVDEVEERQVALRKIRHLGRPVVHLDVDVDVVIGLHGGVEPCAQRPCRFAGSVPGRELESSR